MRVDCLNGFYRFYPDNVGDLRVWAKWYDALEKRDNYYTFPALAKAPDHSFKGRIIDDVTYTANYAGEPWEVLKANNLTYDIATGAVVNKYLITDFINLDDGLIINTPFLPQAYSISGFVNRVSGFSGYWDSVFNIFKLERLQYENILG